MNSSAVLVWEALHFLIFPFVRLHMPQLERGSALVSLGFPPVGAPSKSLKLAQSKETGGRGVSAIPLFLVQTELSRAGPSSISALLSTTTPPSTSAPHDYA